MSEKAERPKYELAVISAKPMFLQIEQGDEERWNKELVFALQIVRGNDVLQKCTSDSIMNAIVNLATIGITLNPALALAYLVPRDGKCVLDISYRGLIKIGTDSGSIRGIHANVVYSFDEFDYEEGTNQSIHHKRSMTPPDDFAKDQMGNFWKYFVCAYSVATLHDGNKDYMLMPKYKIEKIRNTSKVKSEKGPWGQWPEEMARKTVIKYHYKTLPQSERLGQAVAILNEHEGLDKLESASMANNSHKQGVLSRFIPQDTSETVIDAVSTADEAEYQAFQTKLQSVYADLESLAKPFQSLTADDVLSGLTDGKVKYLQDLESVTVDELDSILATVRGEIAKGEGDTLFT